MMKYTLVNQVKAAPVVFCQEKSGKIEVCAGAFLVLENKFLFGKRSMDKHWAPGLWDIVGGRSLKNEHPMFTMQRETLEETGIKVLNAELLVTADVTNIGNESPLFKYYIYMVTHFKGTAFNKTKEHSELRWFTRDELNGLPMALSQYTELIDEWLDAK